LDELVEQVLGDSVSRAFDSPFRERQDEVLLAALIGHVKVVTRLEVHTSPERTNDQFIAFFLRGFIPAHDAGLCAYPHLLHFNNVGGGLGQFDRGHDEFLGDATFKPLLVILKEGSQVPAWSFVF
jgi:hypothetical protein